MIGCGMSGTVPGGLGEGVFGDILSFIPATIQAAGSIAGNVPGILAATGNKKAVDFMTQQASLQCSASGGNWENGVCDMGDVAVRRETTAMVKAYAPWVALGVGGLGLAIVTVIALKSRRAA